MGKRVPEHIVSNMKTRIQKAMFCDCIYETKNISYPLNCSYRSDYKSDYHVNIGHFLIKPYFDAFRQFCGGSQFPLSDNQRLMFESDMVLNIFKTESKRFLENYPNYRNKLIEYQTIPKFKKKFDSWVRFRTDFFPEKQVV